MLRSVILAASRNARVKALVAGAPVSRDVVRRYVAGEQVEDAVRTARELVGKGLLVTLDRLGEDTLDAGQADATVTAYLLLLQRLAEEGLTAQGRAEVSVKLTAVGQAIDEGMALEGARRICEGARNAGTTVTLDMEDHTTTDSTLRVLAELRLDFPDTGGVLQAYLHRTEDDCRRLATRGSRVRLCKGAYQEPAEVAFQEPHEVDLAYVRCMKLLLAGDGYPMLATHDPRLVEIGQALGGPRGAGRRGDYEFQMLLGVRPREQERLAADGEKVRVYVPYGVEWYGYLMRRMAERPANTTLFLRSLVSTT